MEINYPILEISEEAWKNKNIKDFYILFDSRLRNLRFPFKKMRDDNWYRNLLFVDINGKLIKIKGLRQVQKTGFTRFIPFYEVFEYEFEATNKTIQLSEIKELLTKRAHETKNEELASHITSSTTFKELLGEK
jgi:hypothetical protein